MERSGPGRRLAAVGVCCSFGAVASARLFDVPLPPCPLWTVTGVECPGCGSGRSIGALLSGDLVAAFTFNPLVPVALAAFVALVVAPSSPVGSLLTRRHSAVVVASVVAVFWVARLVPLPFLDVVKTNR